MKENFKPKSPHWAPNSSSNQTIEIQKGAPDQKQMKPSKIILIVGKYSKSFKNRHPSLQFQYRIKLGWTCRKQPHWCILEPV